jgi:lipopolysaccharide export system permease protein
MFRGRTLRSYIFKRFLVMILGAFTVVLALIYMIDLIELLRQARDARTLTMRQLMWIAALRLPSFSEILMPFCVLAGSIAALLSLGRKSELTVMRAGGMSVWQFLRPGLTAALLLGVFSVAIYNPLAAEARSESERLMASAFGKDVSLMQGGDGGNWLRQSGVDGQSVIQASAVSNQGLNLHKVIVFSYDPQGKFIERIDADQAELNDGHWLLRYGWLSRPDREAERFETYTLSTFLTRERVQEAIGSVNSISVFELPAVIEMAERSNLPVSRYRMQFETMIARPLLLMAMVLLAATVSLRSFRMGGIQSMVTIGVLGGLLLFLLSEASRQVGLSGLVSARIAVWLPIVVSTLIALTTLLRQEDG